MDKGDGLPFEVGQLCEARSFLRGFRGAWFRCKIKEISWRKGDLHHLLEFYDFPDEKEKWTKLYQVCLYHRKKGEPKRQLMVRPQYPRLYLEDQMPVHSSISEVIVITTGCWNVGDLVDWWTDDCNWSGKITRVLGDGKAEIEFPPPPLGEGSTSEVSFKDLRPSLDWCPEDGWTVPSSAVGAERRQCARLIRPVNEAGGNSSACQMPSLLRTNDSHSADQLSSVPSRAHLKSIAPSVQTSGTNEILQEPSSQTGKRGRNMNLVPEDNDPKKARLAENNSSPDVPGGSAATVGHMCEEDSSNYSSLLKKLRTRGLNALNSLHLDTLDAAVLDVELLTSKIKLARGLLEVDVPFSNAVQHSWRFVEHRAPSMPK